MVFERLETEQALAYFDEDTRIVYVAYSGSLGSEVTVEVYEWLDRLIKAIGLDAILGEVFDFSRVTEFQESNLQTARKTSKRMNIRVDTSRIPVALVVDTFYQEEILRGSMQISPDHVRKRIVHTHDEALAFLQAFNTSR